MDDFESMSGMKRHYDDDDAGLGDDDDLSENEHQTSKSRGTVTVQIFIKSKFLHAAVRLACAYDVVDAHKSAPFLPDLRDFQNDKRL
jgi:hypothetical protein